MRIVAPSAPVATKTPLRDSTRLSREDGAAGALTESNARAAPVKLFLPAADGHSPPYKMNWLRSSSRETLSSRSAT
jgi:hypothetical protein